MRYRQIFSSKFNSKLERYEGIANFEVTLEELELGEEELLRQGKRRRTATHGVMMSGHTPLMPEDGELPPRPRRVRPKPKDNAARSSTIEYIYHTQCASMTKY